MTPASASRSAMAADAHALGHDDGGFLGEGPGA